MRFLAVLVPLLASIAAAQSTAFTYQGSLRTSGSPANGIHDFRFRLYAASSGGSPIGTTQCVDNLQVADGQFNATLDFGQQFDSAASRFLEIDVRADTGLTCADAAGFTTLTPRQPLTPAPAANHAKSAFSLDAPDGSHPNVVFVANTGNVGIGTTDPQASLHIRAGSSGEGLRIQGTSSTSPNMGFLSFYSLQGGRLGYIGNASPSDSGVVVSADLGDVILSSLGVRTLYVRGTGFVGVGASNPTDKLDVRGNIKLGTTGQFYAPGGEENLRIIRGVVSGAGGIIVGSGFNVVHGAAGSGQYTINFNTPFTGAPAVTATADLSGREISTVGATANWVGFQVNALPSGVTDAAFHFIAIGPR